MASGSSPECRRAFDSLPSTQKAAVFRRLRELLRSDDPYSLSFVEMLKAKSFERVRKFRTGNYRVFFVGQPGEVTHLKHTYQGKYFCSIFEIAMKRIKRVIL